MIVFEKGIQAERLSERKMENQMKNRFVCVCYRNENGKPTTEISSVEMSEEERQRAVEKEWGGEDCDVECEERKEHTGRMRSNTA